MYVLDEDGHISGVFDVRQSIMVEMEYQILEGGHLCVAEFTFRNEADLVLFIVLDRDPVWSARSRPIGRYISTVMVPGNLLSEGVVRVHAALLTTDPFRLHAKIFDAIGFQINENGVGPSARGDFTGRWPGALRPLLRRTTEYASRET